MQKILDHITTIILTLITIVIIVKSTEARSGAINGLELCTQIIIPSLLPILIIISTIANSRCVKVIDFLFSPIVSKIFNLPKQATTAIIFGMISGYPSGAILTGELYNSGKITQKDAKRIMHFNLCGGIAFIATAVGGQYLNSIKLGMTAYIICTISNILVGITEGLWHRGTKYYYYNEDVYPTVGQGFINSVENSTKAILVMSGYIIFFSAITNIINIPKATYPLLEITNGIWNFNGKINFEYLCYFINFGGICIHLQIMGICKKIGLSYTELFASRIAASVTAYFAGKLYLAITPQVSEVFSNISQTVPKPSQTSTELSIILIISCIVIILDLKSKQSKLINHK